MLEHVARPLVVLMVPVAFVVRRVIRQAFGSLEEAATAIEAARGHERGFRIDTSHLPAETLPFTDAVNDLLGRLADAAMRQETFVAVVAHELRTPIAVLLPAFDMLDHDDSAPLKHDVAPMHRMSDPLKPLPQLA